MSDAAAADESQKPKKQCVVFEPQAWRKTLCRNCFKTKTDHPTAASDTAGDQQKHQTSPVGNDDYVVIGRREGTPLKDRSRSSTPTASSTPAATATATPAANNTPTQQQDTSALVGKQKDSKTNKDTPTEKEKDKAKDETRSEVDKKSLLSRAGGRSDAAAVGKSEVQKQDQSSAAHVKQTKTDAVKTPINIDREQRADSRPAADKQTAAAASSQAAENNEAGKAVNIQGHSAAAAAAEAPTSATAAGPGAAGGNAVNSSAAINKDAAASSAAAVQPHSATASPRSESSHHGNASSSQVMREQHDTQQLGDTPDSTTITRGPVVDVVGSSSGNTEAAAAASVTAAAVAASASDANSRSSDEIIGGDVARSAEASQAAADVTKIDQQGSGERSAAVGQDVGAGAPGAAASCEKVNAGGLSEDAQRQLDLTADQRHVDVSDATASVPAAGAQTSDLFTNDDVANSSASDTARTSSSISQPATAVDRPDSRPAQPVLQQSPAALDNDAATTGNDSAPPELTSCDSAAAGHAKVEATITLSGSSSPHAVDKSRPIHIVSAAGITGYQRGGDWTASQSVDDSDSERSRLPPDYTQSSASSVGSDDAAAYGPTSPLVDYLSRSPFARSLHGAVERSPETEIVAATGGSAGGETSLFHHVPAASDNETLDTAAAGVGVADWETEQSRNGAAVRSAADSDSDSRLFNVWESALLLI